ncbi:hypothetical protein [Tunturiibacter gelidiferens]|uniref:hypothetical protein n=1 Tax=Tunturiibacter gelidiferens TaxID=3069689 RepID=UPI003D9B1E60
MRDVLSNVHPRSLVLVPKGHDHGQSDNACGDKPEPHFFKPNQNRKNPEQRLSTGSSAAAGIVFGLLCSLIVWLFLAYGIYRIHEMFIPIR